MKLKLLSVFIAVAALTTRQAMAAEQGDDNPTGVAGIFNGQITTAGNFDPYTGNALREVDDIVVPGSLGAYPLKWSRYFNSHLTYQNPSIGGQWRYSYRDYQPCQGAAACTPDGRVFPLDGGITPVYGVAEHFDSGPSPYNTLYLADGGRVVYNGVPIQIIDPYGLVTTLTWTGSPSHLDKITEPGGRYLQITWDSTYTYITSVKAFDGTGNNTPTQWVNYTWTTQTLTMNGTQPHTFKVLTRADYSDGSFATYTYMEENYPVPVCTPPHTDYWYAALLATADDVHHDGPMRQIAYQYYTTTNKTRISSEKNLVTGEPLSTIVGMGNVTTIQVQENRGDGASRILDYYKGQVCRDCPPADSDSCPRLPIPTDGKLQDYTDFLGHMTTLNYETNDALKSAGFITSVIDANGNTTTYTRQTGSWGITRITFPPTPSEPNGSFITQDFWPPDGNGNGNQTQPYYLWKRTDERGNTTVYTRDSNNRITRKDYPTPDATTIDPSPAQVYETFTYNSFNQVLTHRLTNGGTESYAYDSRGLKTSYTDPLGAYPGDPAHTTTYSYYTSGPWTDRLQTVTFPANSSSQIASDTYDYDRAYDANNENSGASTAQAAAAGLGLVTRITHADGKYQAFGYDKYGDKLWQEDELRHRTTMVYDAYKRVLTTTDPLSRTVTNNYIPTGKTSSWITTSNLSFYTTLPSTKKTTFYYDANWRKTRIQQAPGTSDEANTYFAYDNVGNLLTTQDPRGKVTTNSYDARNRLTSTSDALNHATTFTYDAHSNKLTTTKANGEVITNRYDKLNRVNQIQTTREASITDIRNLAFDAAGNLMKFQDENATARTDSTNIYTYTYDLRNRVTSAIYPIPSPSPSATPAHEDTSYDAAGNIVTYKNRAGATKTFSQFDSRNRSHYFSWNDGITPWQSTNFDDASRITQIANSVSTINNTYLNDNRLSTQEEWTSAFNDNVHRTVNYTYDVDGNRLTIQYPSGTAFNYTYTNRNQVASIKPGLSGGTAIVSYTFDATGNITNRSLDNGTSTAYTVDDVNRDTAVVHNLQPTGTTKRFDYVYNNVNDITTVQRDSGLGDGYTYDLTQEIKGFQQNGTFTSGNINSGTGTTTNLTFDGCGNQTSVTGGSTFAVDYLNEYTTFNGAPLTNDPDGDVLTYNGWIYVYDAQNRLTSASKGGTAASFYYDGLNRQIARSINGIITFSVWDGDWAVLEEYSTSNAITQKYLQGYHGLVKTLQDNNYYYQDELGSTSHIASASGALLEYYKYNLYGAPTYWNASGTQITATGYNVHDLGDGGARWIPELGLYDDRNRFMSPDLGRFIQPDPVGFKGDASNLYRYCGNDWANRTDPMGLDDAPPKNQSHQEKMLRAEYNAKLWNAGATVLAGLSNSISKVQQSTQQSAKRNQSLTMGYFDGLGARVAAVRELGLAVGEHGTIRANGYNAADNDPPGTLEIKGGNGTAHLGRGSYNDPTTMAVRKRTYLQGDKKGYFRNGDLVHLGSGRGWFRVEDICGKCGNMHSVDQWTGNSTKSGVSHVDREYHYDVYHPGQSVPPSIRNDARAAEMPY